MRSKENGRRISSFSRLPSLGLWRSEHFLEPLIWNGSNPRSKQDKMFVCFLFCSIMKKQMIRASFVSQVRSHGLQCTSISSLLTTWPSAASTKQAAHNHLAHTRSLEHRSCPDTWSLMASSLSLHTDGLSELACHQGFPAYYVSVKVSIMNERFISSSEMFGLTLLM